MRSKKDKAKRAPLTDEQKIAISEDYHFSGLSLVEIAEKHNIEMSSINKAAKIYDFEYFKKNRTYVSD